MKQKILLISGALPPEPGGSAVIVGNLAKQFTAEEMLLAGEQPYRRPAVSWNHSWPQLVYIASAWPATWRGARWWRLLQFPLMLLRAIRLAKAHRCSAVVTVFPNEIFLFVGYLTALWRRAALFLYFHNTYAENRKGLSLRFARWLQDRVFTKAAHVFVMSEGMAELYRERYPGLKCSPLVHSFSEPIPLFSPPPKPGLPLRLTICGNINESCREATVRICNAIFQIDDASLTLLSGTPPGFLKKLGLLREGVRHETVARDEVIMRLREADIVMLPHGFSGGCSPEEYRTMFPTKTIEYLICGRPILAHTPPDCFLTRFLREHGCALIVDKPSISALIEAINRLCWDASLRSELVRNALRTAEMFQAPLVAKALRARLQHN